MVRTCELSRLVLPLALLGCQPASLGIASAPTTSHADEVSTAPLNPVVRAYGWGDHFYTLSGPEAAGVGYKVESLMAFFLLPSQAAGTVPFYRCWVPAMWRHLYTVSANCEGTGGKNEGQLGFIANGPLAGTTALYRLYHPSGDHLYTTSAAERDSTQGSGYRYEGVSGYVWPNDNVPWLVGTPTPLVNLRRVRVGNDYRTADHDTTRNAWVAAGGRSEGSYAWIPSWTSRPASVLFREDNGAWWSGYSDSMDSTTLNEGGYSTEGGMGFLFANPGPGLNPVARFYNRATGDHLSNLAGGGAPGGYDYEGTMGYGFAGRGQSTVWLRNYGGTSTTAINLNLLAGAAVWQYWYRGHPFINNFDYGRLLQSDVFIYRDIHGVTPIHINPTEAGDAWTHPVGMLDEDKHGTPFTALWQDSAGLHTRAIPFEFAPNAEVDPGTNLNFGVGPDHPVAYMDMTIGKDMQFGVNGWDNVTKYTSVFTYPSPIQYAWVEMPALFLTPLHRQIWQWDPHVNGGSVTPAPVPNACRRYADYPFSSFSDCGGIIGTDPGSGYSMGIYVCKTSVGGSAHYLRALMSIDCTVESSPVSSADYVQLSAFQAYWMTNSFPMLTGTRASLASYLVTGRYPGEVEATMRNLYNAGYR
jgi:hypothetical protein